MSVYRLLRPLLFRIDAEHAHRAGKLALRALGATRPLARGLAARNAPSDPRLAQRLLGRTFPGPLGLAAGFDKDAEMVAALPALGFAFAELGTVTPLAQPGNPRPRLFRFPEAESVLNRLGFNNRGMEALAGRLERLPAGLRQRFPLGINLGKNKATPDAAALDDYRRLAERLGRLADYLVINVSSPNTPGLRDLQNEAFLGAVLAAARAATDRPVLVKLSPDLELPRAVALAAAAVDAGAAGIVATNTTTDLSLLPRARGAGGLSGAVLREKSRRMLAALAGELGGRCLLVSAGGIGSADEAYRRIRAGAHLVQLYTALVFAGPFLPRDIHRGLLRRLDRDGLPDLAAAVGADRARPSAGADGG